MQTANTNFLEKKLLYTCCALCCEISLAPCPANPKGVIQKMHLEFIAEADDSKSETHRKVSGTVHQPLPFKGGKHYA